MNRINYSKKTELIIENNKREQILPSLLIHACCAPCSSACLEYLNRYFKITVYFYNPNISPKAEFNKRLNEEKRLLNEMPFSNSVEIIEGKYDYNEFLKISKGLEKEPEGGKRCLQCYKLRLEKTAETAKNMGFDYFCTTLSISPLKDSRLINRIGYEAAEKFGVLWLPSDFKKKEGYKRSVQLSREYGLYRQNFCGCDFSKADNFKGDLKNE
ncbi:MAG: epoxyqueuosine reductase QueH [Clostridiales bacterium]|nr:epoxyqueuosine reductase QueH [Clostridiales bacterium]